MPKKLEEIADIPSADMVNDDKKIKAMLLQTKAFTRDEFSRLLLSAITSFVIMINYHLKQLLMR